MLRGVRGAITASVNNKSEILSATKEVLKEMLNQNKINSRDIACIVFSSTPDLNAAHPAAADRELGLLKVPLFGTCEADVPGSPAKCIIILILLNTNKSQEEINHVYLKGAQVLRPDLVESTKETNPQQKGEPQA